jgi:transposase-like protein
MTLEQQVVIGMLEEVLAKIEQLQKGQDELRAAVIGDEPGRCPYCGSEEVADTTCMGEPQRLTCSDCGRSWNGEGQEQPTA